MDNGNLNNNGSRGNLPRPVEWKAKSAKSWIEEIIDFKSYMLKSKERFINYNKKDETTK